MMELNSLMDWDLARCGFGFLRNLDENQGRQGMSAG